MTAVRYRAYLETDLNRVFAESLGELAAAELAAALADRSGGGAAPTIEVHRAGRAQYLGFESSLEPTEVAALLSTTSSTSALFVEHPGEHLTPLVVADDLVYGTELVSAQRYKGKTNERLTRMMLNLALPPSGSAHSDAGDVSILDPMCGRGTTLNWALLYGYRAVGIDIDRRSVEDHASFLEEWAKRNRLPHRIQRYRKNNAEGRVFDLWLAPDRASLKALPGPNLRTLCGDTFDASIGDLPVGRHDAIVVDLPYSVQHAPKNGSDGPTSIAGLLEGVMPAWRRWTTPESRGCLAWNAKRAPHAELRAVLEAGGFSVEPTRGFEHRVDRMITRDLIRFSRSTRR